MVYVFQMFFSWDRRSQGTFPAVTWTVSRFIVSALTCFINLYIIYTVQAKEIFYKTRKSLIVKTTTRDSYNSLEDFWFIPPEEYRT